MRILQLHSDFIEYKPIEKEIEIAEDCEQKLYRFEEIVVLFTTVETGDDESVALQAVKEVKRYLEKVKVNRILIYPYAHLSSNLARPLDAIDVLKRMEEAAKNFGIETYRAPFGWCKKFTISIKGHPLAEQSRIILPSKKKSLETVSKALVAEEKIKSYWYILKPDGKLVPVEEFDFKDYGNLEKFAKYEISKIRAAQQVPPHVTLMRRLEIADYEPGSDPGNMRWYPKGALIKSLIEELVTEKVIEYGGMKVETPVMYDMQHPSLADYFNRFPARQYIVKSEDKDYFLRFSACFGQFLMMHDAQISYRQLPLRIYELTRYSFRREKSGELSGLRRLRAFTMPDCHALCADLTQAKEEAIRRFRLCRETLEAIGLKNEDYELAIRFTREFYENNREFVVSLVREFGRPALIEMWDKQFFYFILKWEFNFVDNLDKASALSTDQIDTENGQRYGITYVDETGKRRHPLILHCSPSGAIERVIYALLEKAYKEQAMGKAPMLPVWLSPTQVRFIPVSEQFMNDVKKIIKEIEAEERRIRVDIDDRPLTLQRKIRDAEREWVPYIVVVGKKEVESGVLSVRDRKIEKIGEPAKIRKMTVRELIDEIRSLTKDKPFKSLTLPKALSLRPKFYG